MFSSKRDLFPIWSSLRSISALNNKTETVFIDIEYVQNTNGSFTKDGLVYTPGSMKLALHQEIEQMSVLKYETKLG